MPRPRTSSSPARLAGAEAWQPFIYQTAQGQPVGLAVDALGRAARAEGHRIRYLFLAPASCLRLMKEQRIDIMAFATAEGSPPGWLQTQQPLVYWVLNAWVRADNPLRHYPGLGHFSAHKVAFVDTAEVLSLESQAHYTRVLTREGYHFCNLSIGDLALRLDPAQFMRVHRCFIVNLQAVQSLGREGSKTHVVLKGKHSQPVPVSRGEVGRLREALGLG